MTYEELKDSCLELPGKTNCDDMGLFYNWSNKDLQFYITYERLERTGGNIEYQMMYSMEQNYLNGKYEPPYKGEWTPFWQTRTGKIYYAIEGWFRSLYYRMKYL